MLTTIKQSGNSVKYNEQKNRITVQVLTTDKSVEMGTTKTIDPSYQTFKPYELDGNVFRELKENEKLCVMLDNNKDDNILASLHRGNLTEVVHNGLYGLAIEIDDEPIMTEFIKLVQQNKIESIQIYTDQVTSLNKLIEKINYIKAISINTK